MRALGIPLKTRKRARFVRAGTAEMRPPRIFKLAPALAGLLVAAPALGAPLSVTKTATVISDPLGDTAPKSLPGAVVDYKVVLTNPLSNVSNLQPLTAIVIDDMLPTTVVLRVSDLAGTGKGPVEFLDGALIPGLGLLNSGLTCSFVSLASTTDCVDFNDGTAWGYVPVPDANGYDARVRAIRLKPITNITAGGSFQLRYRVMIR